jgi:hypothetical protein
MTDPKVDRVMQERNAKKNRILARRQWLMPVIPVTQEAKIRRITVQSQPKNSLRDPIKKKKSHKNKRVGGVAQAVRTPA